MVEAAERLKGIEPTEVLTLCKKYLNSWDVVTDENFDFQVLNQGFGNRLFICGVKDGLDSLEPKKVLVRYYGGNFLPKDAPIRTLSEAGEVLVFYALAKKGYGPKLHGVFDGGRIEEFIPSRGLTLDEWENDEEVNTAVARRMARYHTVDLPIRKRPWDIVQICRDQIAKFALIKDELPPPPPDMPATITESLNELFAFDVLAEADWAARIMAKIASRVVFAHNDSNRSNILLKESGASLFDRMMLIDYEFSGYNYRGADIGNLFWMRVFDFGSEKFVSGFDYPTEDARRQFIRAYADECKISGAFPDWDENGRDSEDHLVIEAEFYGILCRLISVAWMLGDFVLFMKMGELRKDKDPDAGGPGVFCGHYLARKAIFLKQYPQFA